jgi:Putative Flp pilus-assembly TadE/G-like
MRGQALALFSVCLSTLLLAVALAFDAGAMMLERRDQQNAADAAAIAAARYVGDDIDKARSVAADVAAANGFVHGVNAQTVAVNIPPTTGPNQGKSKYVEVHIGSSRPSLFAGIVGVASWPIAARAVATNGDAIDGLFSILSLHPTECDAMLVSGSGNLLAYGHIQVNSTCNNGAMRRSGGGSINVDVDGGSCNVVGDIRDGGGTGGFDCIQNEGAPEVPDPLVGLPVPAVPALPLPMAKLSGSGSIPDGCPGSGTPATLAAPRMCQFQSSYAGSTWRIYPGLYAGGLKLQGGTFYFEPGIYYIAGGGVDLTGSGTTTLSVDAGGTTGPTGGVMFYNTEVTGSAVGPITMNGSSANIQLMPLDLGLQYDGLIIWQDRSIDINGDDVTINGGSSDMVVRGTIYVPFGDVKVNGGSGTLTMDQVIANTYVVFGAPGSLIKVLKEEFFRFKLLAAGLVE